MADIATIIRQALAEIPDSVSASVQPGGTWPVVTVVYRDGHSTDFDYRVYSDGIHDFVRHGAYTTVPLPLDIQKDNAVLDILARARTTFPSATSILRNGVVGDQIQVIFADGTAAVYRYVNGQFVNLSAIQAAVSGDTSKKVGLSIDSANLTPEQAQAFAVQPVTTPAAPVAAVLPTAAPELSADAAGASSGLPSWLPIVAGAGVLYLLLK